MTHRRRKPVHGVKIALSAFVLQISPCLLYAQCAMCRESLARDGREGLISGIRYSILLLGGMPFLLAGTIAFLVYRSVKSKGQSRHG